MSNALQSSTQSFSRSLAAPTLFEEMGLKTRESLLEKALLRRFNSGQIIEQRGDAPSGVWVVESGTIKVGQFLPNGDFRVLALLSVGDSYGELAVFAHSRRAVDAVAEGSVALRWIDAATFEAALMKDSAAMRRLISVLAAQMQTMLGQLVASNGTSSISRLASLLLNLAGQSEESPTIPLGQQELAELLGLTRATINKALSSIEAAGAIKRQYGAVYICDRHRLSQYIQE